MSVDILIIDDEADIRDLIAGILEDNGYETRTAATSEEAISCLNERLPSLVVLDVWLKGSEMDGLNLLSRIKETSAEIPVIMISGHSTVEMATSAIKMGAEDFLPKPFESAHLAHCIERALKELALRRENRELQLSSGDLVPHWIGDSTVAVDLLDKVEKLSQSSSRVIIWGERGVGKATLARMIHAHSERRLAHFNIFNCGNVSEADFESELLGVELEDEVIKLGAFENSHNGVLLLEDIDKMPSGFQNQFARILQSGNFARIGGKRSVSVDVRVIVTSLLSPDSLQDLLHSDLYHRLNVDSVLVPPLRDRRDDIEPFFMRFVKLRSTALRCLEPSIEEGGISLLQAYDWLGNIRQMKNVVASLLDEGRQGTIGISQIEACLSSNEDDDKGVASKDFLHDDLRTARNSFEKEYLNFHLQRFNGNIAKTAEFVGMERTALHRKLKSLKLL